MWSGYTILYTCSRGFRVGLVIALMVIFMAVDMTIDGVHLSQRFTSRSSLDTTSTSSPSNFEDLDFPTTASSSSSTSQSSTFRQYEVPLSLQNRDPFYSPRWREDAPCWCSSLHVQIKESIDRLVSRYGRKHLKASIQYSTSGIKNNLERRLLRSLNGKGKDPFHIAILGGSYSLPNMYNGNAWSFNVTRWLNTVLSTSTCDAQRIMPVSDAHAHCKNKTKFLPSERYKNCPISTPIVHNQAVFCSKFSENPDIERARHPNAKSFDDICDASVPPARNCNVYGGSGEFATMVMGSKGGTTTNTAVWTIDSIYNNDEVDLMIWDYGMNDMATIPFHKEFLTGFFEKVVYTYPKISTMAAVYWIDESTHLQEQCNINNGSSITWSNDLPMMDYPILKHKFNIENGKFKNHSLISMSLAAFCHSAECVPNDILGANTNHPSDGGTSIMGDLFIWQLIHAFKRIIRRECNKDEHTYDSHSTKHTNSEELWTLDFHNHSYSLRLQQTRAFQKAEIAPYFQKNHTDLVWPVVVDFPFFTPQISRPLPREKFAMLCAPSNLTIKHNHVFDIEAELPLDAKEYWIAASIIDALKHNCSGWHHMGHHDKYRTDDEHIYVSTSYKDCPSGSVGGMTCRRPSSSVWTPHRETSSKDTSLPNKTSNGYPHKFWPQFPMVKAVDLFFRVSSTLDWNILCFMEKCNPIMVWRNELDGKIDTWESRPLEKLKDTSKLPGSKYCTQRSSNHYVPATSTNITHYYLWFPADLCYSWDASLYTESMIKKKDEFGKMRAYKVRDPIENAKWTGNFVSSSLVLLKDPVKV